MKSKVPVSIIIPAKNERNNIVKCLNSLDWADEVFVVDSQSTDGTIELAERNGAKVAFDSEKIVNAVKKAGAETSSLWYKPDIYKSVKRFACVCTMLSRQKKKFRIYYPKNGK